MQVLLRAVDEPLAGERWAASFLAMWPAYRRWFLREGDAARPSYRECERALRRHMPELLSTYERVVDLAGGGDLVARCLSLYRPTPYVSGCSQAVWLRDRPLLVRNYDYAPELWEALILRTHWLGKDVVAMSDCGWGALDGINEAGLSVSLAFGGRKVVGEGFGIPLVLRYILETCERVEEAERVLTRVPSHMAYNVTVLDRLGKYVTAYVAPDRPTVLSRRRVATNHQRRVEWSQYVHATASLDRFQVLDQHVDAPTESVDRFLHRFLEPPTYQGLYSAGWGTLYTAVYDPVKVEVEYRWPTRTWKQSPAQFEEGALEIDFPTEGPRSSHSHRL